MKPTKFFDQKIKQIFSEKKYIVDIGGGLRIDPHKNNRKKEHAWLDAFLPHVQYVVLDKVPDHNPDIVGDVHHLPFPDNSVEAILLISLLEHVEEPHRAVQEAYRVLKPGGYCFIEVPFLLYYHPMPGYYKDYFRFTRDGLEYLIRDFKEVEIETGRGALATVMNLLPFFTKRTGFFDFLDKVFKKNHSNQTSHFTVFCVK